MIVKSIINEYEILKLEDLSLESDSKEPTDSDDEEYIFMNIELEGLDLEQLDEKIECQHKFIHRQGFSNNIICNICKLFLSIEFRYKCRNCKVEICTFCSIKTYEKQLIEIQGLSKTRSPKFEKD